MGRKNLKTLVWIRIPNPKSQIWLFNLNLQINLRVIP